MPENTNFELVDFIPYLMNQAAHALSLEFQPHYKDRYGMLLTEWRVLFHVGLYDGITAKEICERARLHKTKVSRAVTGLEQKRYVVRTELENDRRHSSLSLSRQGQAVYKDLCQAAQTFDEKLRRELGDTDAATLHRILTRISGL